MVSTSTHILELCRDLLDDIELSRLSSDKVLLKCTRLARLAGSDEVLEWLGYEMGGYSSTKIGIVYMGITGRWIDREQKKGYWGPLAEQEAKIKANEAKLNTLQLPSTSGDKAWIVTRDVLASIQSATNAVSTFTGIKSRVIGRVHSIVSNVYYERLFASTAKNTFEQYQSEVDLLVEASCADVLKKLPSVIDRLNEGDNEAISQALLTIRRIIESFADAVYPAREQAEGATDNAHRLDASKHLNRINAYISERTDSESRRQRLRQNLSNLYARACAGVHDTIGAEESFSLFLNPYLFLGETLSLDTP